jgi:MipA family protein
MQQYYTSLCQIVGIAILSLSAGLARSAELGDFYNLGPRPKETTVRVGLVSLGGMRYQGSDESRFALVPGVLLQTANGFFADPFNGVGYAFEPAGALQYGVRLGIDTGRDKQDALPGFEKIKTSLNPGVFANYAVSDTLTLKSSLRVGLAGESSNALLNLGATYKLFQAGPVVLTATASAKYANAGYMQSYFGVSAAQAAASGFKTYQPSAGFSTVQLGLTGGFPVSREIYIISSLGVQQIVGDAAKSPLVKQKTVPTGFIGAVYSF